MKKDPFAFVLDQLETRLPDQLKPFHTQVKAFSRQLLQEKLSALDLVPREAFEQQEHLLEQAEQRVAQLEARVAALEKGAA